MYKIVATILNCFICMVTYGQLTPHFKFPSWSGSRRHDSLKVLNANTPEQGSIVAYSDKESYRTLHNKVYYSSRKIRSKKVDIGNESPEEYVFRDGLSMLDTPSLNIQKCDITNFYYDGGIFNGFYITNSIIKSLSLSHFYVYDYFVIVDTSCTKIDIRECNFQNSVSLSFSNKEINALSLRDCVFRDFVDIDIPYLPDTINLQNLDLTNYNGVLDFSRCKSVGGRKCYINLYQTDVNKVRLKYTDFQLLLPQSISFEDSVYVYQSLLNKFSKEGLPDSYKKLDIELRELKYRHEGRLFTMWVNKYWWNYGYDKQLVFKNALLISFFFFLINLFCFRALLLEVYTIDPIRKQYERVIQKYSGNGFWKSNLLVIYCYIYTCYIFWGIKLDYLKLNLKSVLFAWVIFQYVIGIICIAYIANYIITVK